MRYMSKEAPTPIRFETSQREAIEEVQGDLGDVSFSQAVRYLVGCGLKSRGSGAVVADEAELHRLRAENAGLRGELQKLRAWASSIPISPPSGQVPIESPVGKRKRRAGE